MKIKEILKVSSIPVIAASLCCLSPIIIVLLGLGGVTFASTLADSLYGDWKWAFRGLGLILLAISLFLYFRKQGICTLDQAKRNRRKIINTVLATVFAGVLGYIIFLYVIVHYWGVWMGLWG